MVYIGGAPSYRVGDTCDRGRRSEVRRQEREELERQVLLLERQNPSWTAAEVDRELAERAPVAHGVWKEEVPEVRSRHRSIQRWRAGARRSSAGRSARLLFPYLWPVGERQRREVDPTHEVSSVIAAGSWRLFLYNCGTEVARDVRVALDGADLDYAPAILTGRLAEVHWQRVEAIKAFCLRDDGEHLSRHRLRVDFVIAQGTREARLEGVLTLHNLQGWALFESPDGRRREIE